MICNESGLSEETLMMRDVTRKFVNEHVIPFTRQNWQAEWSMKPDGRLPPKILEVAHQIGIRTLGVPEEYGGNGCMLDFGIEKLYRDATMYLHTDDRVDVTKFKIVKNLFPETAGKYAGND